MAILLSLFQFQQKNKIVFYKLSALFSISIQFPAFPAFPLLFTAFPLPFPAFLSFRSSNPHSGFCSKLN